MNVLCAGYECCLFDCNYQFSRAIVDTGDNVLTAVSVARTCGMVYDSTMLITVDGHPPANGKPASLRWILDGTKDEEKHEKPALNGKLTV